MDFINLEFLFQLTEEIFIQGCSQLYQKKSLLPSEILFLSVPFFVWVKGSLLLMIGLHFMITMKITK